MANYSRSFKHHGLASVGQVSFHPTAGLPSQSAAKFFSTCDTCTRADRKLTSLVANVATSSRDAAGLSNQDQAKATTWKIRMLYDGECPLCMKEVDFLRKRDANVGNIEFVDISSPTYSAADNAGIEFETAMGSIHAIRADGGVIHGIQVFQELYDAVGLGWVYAATKWKPIYNLAQGVYDFWAKYRLPITGRPALEQVLESRQNEGKGCGDEDSVCEIPLDKLYPPDGKN